MTYNPLRITFGILAFFFLFLVCSQLQADTFGSGSNTFAVAFSTVGDPGNAGNATTTGTFGAVPYIFQIGTYDISVNQLNAAVANGLQGMPASQTNAGDQPAAQISWYQAAAFVNWLNTSQGYTPAYNLTYSGGFYTMALWTGSNIWTTGGTNPYRNANCYYFLPNENEFYKAAFYNGSGYNAYTTGTVTPTAVASGTAANTAIFGGVATTPASVYLAGGAGHYGAVGMAGNVFQWSESDSSGAYTGSTNSRYENGGLWTSSSYALSNGYHPGASGYQSAAPTSNYSNAVGFRVAAISTALPVGSQPAIQQAVELAHQTLWSKFVSADGIIRDYIGETPNASDCLNGVPNALGWWSPTENGSFFNGLYLVAQVERARRTGSQTDINQARILANGLIKTATCTLSGSITGFIGRGFATDGTSHYPIGSDDQTHPWFMGLYAYYKSGIPSDSEKASISSVVEQVANALQAPSGNSSWNCPCEGVFAGQYRGWMRYSSGFRGSSRFLFILHAVYEMTGDPAWLTRYQTACTETSVGGVSGTTRLQYCAAGLGTESLMANPATAANNYIFVGAVESLKYLILMDSTNQATFQTGLNNSLNFLVNGTALNQYTNWNEVTEATAAFNRANWRSLYSPYWYPQKYVSNIAPDANDLAIAELGANQGAALNNEINYMKVPLCNASMMALAGNARTPIEPVLKNYTFPIINLSQFFFAEIAYYALPAPPVITVTNTTVLATSKLGAVVQFNPTAIDPSGGGVTLTNVPAWGSVFPVGSCTVLCTASSSAGGAWSTPFTVTVLPTYAATFLSQYSLSGTNPAYISNTKGITNLAAYAFGMNPLAPDTSKLPSVTSTNGYLQVSFPQWISVSDLNYVVEVSSDLQNWYSGSAYTQQISTNPIDDLFQQVVVQDLTPVSGVSRRFMRVKLQH